MQCKDNSWVKFVEIKEDGCLFGLDKEDGTGRVEFIEQFVDGFGQIKWPGVGVWQEMIIRRIYES